MKFFIPVVLWAILIFILSTKVGIQLPETKIGTDKVAHFAVYFVFNLLAIRGLVLGDNLSTKNVLIATFVVTVYGITMEFIQWAFFPNRFFEVWDMVANFIGAVLGYIAFIFTSQKNNQHGFRN
ncbi:MAG: hypothetical protein GC192_19015 [Bacteroidetes bacterium]|nr:hypothetical protein [Bacteroidota bacterium]